MNDQRDAGRVAPRRQDLAASRAILVSNPG